MTAVIIGWTLSIAVALVVGWLVPAVAIKGLLPSLEASGRRVTNYRGRRIPTGLGLVWLVWAVGVALASTALGYWGILRGTPISLIQGFPLLLVVGSLAFGLVDDVFGGGDAKGFRGHLRAMADGRLTTGGLKLLGIGVLALVVSAGSLQISLDARDPWLSLVRLICGALVIALSANFVNLTDLRPGRAIKAYGFLAITGVVLYVIGISPDLIRGSVLSVESLLGLADAKIAAACLLILLLGPVAAVWRYDLGERAMLGDAGANAMGALAGFFLVVTTPLWLLVVLAFVLLALNLASEKVSFSKVIERVAFLKWIDGLGRVSVGSFGEVSEQDADDGERTGGSASADDEAWKDGGISTR